MSLTKSATRRLSLMAGSSLVVASLSAAASLSLALAPTTAAAQTCTPDPATVLATPTDDSVVCDLASYPTGVTYLTNGNLTVTTTVDAAEWGGNGIELIGTTDDSITFDTDLEIEGRNLTGALLDISTELGDIVIFTEEVDADAHNPQNVTHGIRAISTGGGDINATATGNVSIASSSVAAPEAAVELITAGGNISYTGGGNGGRYGVRAETSGTGRVTLDLGNVSTSNFADDEYTVEVIAGTGPVVIEAERVGNAGGSRRGGGLRLVTSGDAEIELGLIVAAAADNATLDLTMNGAGRLISIVSGLTTAGSNDVTDRVVLAARGAGDLELSASDVRGRIEASDMTGDLTFGFSGEWLASGRHTFGSGVNVVTVAPGGVLVGSTSDMNNHTGDIGVIDPPTVFDFTASQDSRFVNQGMVVVGGVATAQDALGSKRREGELRFEGLQTFENAGLIIMGVPKISQSQFGTPLGEGTDQWIDDMLVLPGATFVGAEGSRIFFDAYLTRNQDACSPSIRVPEGDSETDGDLPAADCVSIHGGATEGVTNVLIHQIAQGDRGGAVKIVLVDVEGGTSGAGHFVLDPENRSYNPDQGGYLDLGYIIYPLVYDEDTQQHMLLGVAGANAWQTATWAVAAHDLWRVSTGSWFERQADLRGDLAEGIGGGVWLRTSGEFANREVAHSMVAGTSPFTFDNSHEQNTYAVTGGLDLLSGAGANSAWVVGLMAGYANSELKFDASPNAGQFNGFTGGAYASWLAGGLYVDAALNANKLDIEMDMPALGLFPEDTLLATRLLSVGGQVEAGWRMPLAGTAFIEPLAGISYVRTSWDDLVIASADPLREGVEVSFDDPASLRANVGARLGLDQRYGGWRAQYSVLGRVWNEFEGEHAATLFNIGDDVIVTDAFTGTLTEFGVGVSLYGPSDAASGFFNFGGKFGDDYDSQNLSAGVRVNW